VQSRDKCGTESKSYDTCPLARYAPFNQVCGTDNVTYDNVLDMACSASKNSIGKLIYFPGVIAVSIPQLKQICVILFTVIFRNQLAECRRVQN